MITFFELNDVENHYNILPGDFVLFYFYFLGDSSLVLVENLAVSYAILMNTYI